MSQDTNLKSLDFVEAANAALSLVDKFALAVDQEKNAAASLAAPVVDSLCELHLIQEHEKVSALQKLGSHDGAVEVVGNLLTQIDRMKTAHAQQLALRQGSSSNADGVKSASDNGDDVSRPIVTGSRPGLGEKRGSDIAFLKAFGISQ